MKRIWSLDNMGAYQAKLGRVNRAIVIVRSHKPFQPNYWRISIASFLPFTDEEHEKEFDNPTDCATFAEGIVLEWLASLMKANETEQIKLT